MAPAIHIELDALCLILLCTIAMQSRQSVNQQKDRILFRTTAYGIILLLALDILWVLIEGRQFPGAVALNLIVNALYLGGRRLHRLPVVSVCPGIPGLQGYA